MLVLLSLFSFSCAENLTQQKNPTTFKLANDLFAQIGAEKVPCPEAFTARTGFFYLCAQAGGEQEALIEKWTNAINEAGATNFQDEALSVNDWSSSGAGKKTLDAVIEDEFTMTEIDPEGFISVQSGQVFE